MKTCAVKEKRPAPETVRKRPYVHAPFGPVQRAQQTRIGRILRSTGAQAKLTIGQPNDRYEQEADRVADQVMAMPDLGLQRQPENEEEEEPLRTKPLADQITPLVQRQEEPPEEEEEPLQAKSWYGETVQRLGGNNCPKCEEEQVQRQPVEEEDEELQTKEQPGQAPQVTPNIESHIHSMKSGGRPLDAATRSFFEPRFGRDFSNVRIHSDITAGDTARSIHARAFTLGNHVVMGSGEYQPNSQSGQRLLGHELTHVVQQTVHMNRIQRQPAQTAGSCTLTTQQNQAIVDEARRGIRRMLGDLRNPDRAFVRLRRHIRATINLTENFIRDINAGRLAICVRSPPCPPGSADACYNPASNQIRISQNVVDSIDQYSVASLLHEYKHSKQEAEYIQNVAQGRRASIYTDEDELRREYSAGLVGAIFAGSIDNLPAPPPSGGELFEVAGPREILDVASRLGDQPPTRSDLPVLSHRYIGQIARDTPVIYYPVQWRGGNLTLYTRDRSRVGLGRFYRADIDSELPITSAFWRNSGLANSYRNGIRNGSWDRGFMVIYSRGSVLKTIPIPSPPSISPTTPRPEGGPIRERQIRIQPKLSTE